MKKLMAIPVLLGMAASLMFPANANATKKHPIVPTLEQLSLQFTYQHGSADSGTYRVNLGPDIGYVQNWTNPDGSPQPYTIICANQSPWLHAPCTDGTYTATAYVYTRGNPATFKWTVKWQRNGHTVQVDAPASETYCGPTRISAFSTDLYCTSASFSVS